MFEDATFDSTCTIRTHSHNWMVATFSLNGSILLALVLIPLLYPEALPPMALPFHVSVPPAPAQPTPPAQPAHAALAPTQAFDGHFLAPRAIPDEILMVPGPEPRTDIASSGLVSDISVPGAMGSGLHAPALPRIVHPPVSGPVRVSSSVVAGLLIRKTMPSYPPLAKAMHMEGTVALAATISKAGTIENLRVVSGPPVLQLAAIDAVKTWIYRPYLLNSDPVEVETTVDVIFTLAR
jgi:protein TonB